MRETLQCDFHVCSNTRITNVRACAKRNDGGEDQWAGLKSNCWLSFPKKPYRKWVLFAKENLQMIKSWALLAHERLLQENLPLHLHTLDTCIHISVHCILACAYIQTRVTHHAIRREVKNGRIAQTSGNCDTHCTYSARHILQHTLQRTLQRTTLPYEALLTHEGTSIHCATCTATHPATLPATQNDSLPDRVGVKKGRVSSGFWMVMSTE